MTKITEICLRHISLGRSDLNRSESEIVRHYVRAISDELEHCAIRHRTDIRPHPWEFVINFGIGWSISKKDVVSNRSRIWISDADSSGVASLLAETLSHWGQTYVGLEHKSCKPIVANTVPSAHIHIEPFQMNGIKADLYAQKLEELGRDIGRAIADYVIRERGGAILKMTTAADLPRFDISARRP